MSVSIKVAEELYDQARSIAEAQHISVEEVFTSAFYRSVCDLAASLRKSRTRRSEKILAIPDKIPDIEPDERGGL